MLCIHGTTNIDCSRCRKKEAMLADKNPMWRGDQVGRSIHAWIERRIARPDRCSNCGSIGKVDLANISQEYKRDLTDWEWLCRRCHMIKDGRAIKAFANLKQPKAIIQIEKTGRFIKRFRSITDAAIETGILRTNIQNVISGLTHTAGGYKWQVAEVKQHSACRCHENGGGSCCDECIKL